MSAKEEKIFLESCSKCGFNVVAPTPPEVCPECKEACEFKNVTCYLPDCGGLRQP